MSLTREKRTELNNHFRAKKELTDNIKHNVLEFALLEERQIKEPNLITKVKITSELRYARRMINDQKHQLADLSPIRIAKKVNLPRQSIVYYEKVFNQATGGVVLS